MEDIGIIGPLLIMTNGLITYQGLKDHGYLDKYSFQVDEILMNRDYKRLLTSGFLHVSWMHFIFNMITLACFSYSLETVLGPVKFIIVYFGSLIGGDLFSLFIHRQHGDYSAVGASGAICGLIFASIALFPGMEIGFLGLHLQIPTSVYGIAYVLISIYGIKSQRDNIGHDAHLGGGLTGLLIAIAMEPIMLSINFLPILLILIPSSVFIYFIVTKPELLLIDTLFQKNKRGQTLEDRYNFSKLDREKEIDLLLDKITKGGMESLTFEEQEKLKKYSNGK